MRRLSYLGRLMRDFWLFAWQYKAWWIIPLVAILVLLAFLAFVGQALVTNIYTLF